MKYAVNLADLTRLAQQHSLNPGLELIKRVLGQQTITLNGPLVDSTIVPLICKEERARAIMEVLRLKLRRHELRLYQSEDGIGKWKAYKGPDSGSDGR